MFAPNNNRGMAYQNDEKHLTIFPEYFVGVVKQKCVKGKNPDAGWSRYYDMPKSVCKC